MASQEEKKQDLQRSRGSDLSSIFSSSNPDLQRAAQFAAVAALSPEEHPDDRAARIIIQGADAKVERAQRIITFAVIHLIIVLTLGACFWVILFGNFTETTKGWAMQLVTAVVTGFIAFVAGQKLTK